MGTYAVRDGTTGNVETTNHPSVVQAIKDAIRQTRGRADVVLHDDSFEGEHDDQSRDCACGSIIVYLGW